MADKVPMGMFLEGFLRSPDMLERKKSTFNKVNLIEQNEFLKVT